MRGEDGGVRDDGEARIPCDFRVYDKPMGGQGKNEPFRAMLKTAKERGFEPEYVRMDRWYSGLENLKLIGGFGWLFRTRLKSNRLRLPDGKGNGPISRVEIPALGRVVHLRGFGFVKVFGTVSQDGDAAGLGDERLGDDPREAGRVKAAGMGHRGSPSGAQAMLGSGEGPGSQSRGYCAPLAFGFASLFAFGSLSFADRGE